MATKAEAERLTRVETKLDNAIDAVNKLTKTTTDGFSEIEARFDNLPETLVTRKEFELMKWVVGVLVASLIPVGIAVFG